MRVTDPAGRIARVAAWGMSAAATVALLGSIATVSDTVPQDTGRAAPKIVDPADSNTPPPRPLPPALDPVRAGANLPPPTVTPATAQAQAARASAGWLEALTYAVLALVAVLSAATIALFRIAARLPRA